MTKRLLSLLLTLATMLSLAVTAYAASGEKTAKQGEGATTSGPILRNTDISSVTWSLTTIDGDTITEKTYADKVVLLVYYRADGSCSMSNAIISSLASSDWIGDSRVQVIAMDCDGNDADTIRAHKEQYAPDCGDIVFTLCHGGHPSLIQRLITQGTLDSDTLAYCFVMKGGVLYYSWSACDSAAVCREAVEDVLNIPTPGKIAGSCGAPGDDVSWSFDTVTGTLTIEGEGAIADYCFGYGAYEGDYSGIVLPTWECHRKTIKNLVIKSGVTRIGADAFRICDVLESVTIPDSVTSIGGQAFADCYALESIVIPDSVTSIGIFAFSGCRALENVTLPSGMTHISSGLLEGCTALKTVTLPESATCISMMAFSNCYALESITIPASVTSIGEYAFSICRALESVTIPDSITSIGMHAFSDCYSLTSATIPASVTSIGEGAFGGCAEDLVIYCYIDTAAEAYALENRIVFSLLVEEDPEPIPTPSGTLATPQITSVTANGKAVTVTWGAVDGAEQYRLFFMKNGKWAKLRDTADTSVTLNGTMGKTYTYTVRCVSADGSKYTSGYDAAGRSITLGVATPSNLEAIAIEGGIKISWGKVDGAAQYRVFYIKNGKWTKLKDTTETSLTLTSGTVGKTYTYTVRCISADGKSYTSGYDTKGVSIVFSK